MRFIVLACALVVAATAACGEDASPSTTGDATTSSTKASSTAGSGGEGGAGGEPSAGGGGAGGADERFVGGVFAISDTVTASGAPSSSSRAGAYFVKQTGVDHSEAITTVGPCTIEKFGSGNPAHETDLSAGALHLTGGAKALDLTPRANATYAPTSASDALWTGGETLTLSADGADVPSFTTTLVAPSTLTLTSPAAAGSGALTVPRSAPFAAAWTGASSGSVVLYFDVATAQAAFSVTCSFDAATGSAEVPAAAFADLPAGQGTFNFYGLERATATPGAWSIAFSASSTIVDASGAATVGYAVFD